MDGTLVSRLPTFKSDFWKFDNEYQRGAYINQILKDDLLRQHLPWDILPIVHETMFSMKYTDAEKKIPSREFTEKEFADIWKFIKIIQASEMNSPLIVFIVPEDASIATIFMVAVALYLIGVYLYHRER